MFIDALIGGLGGIISRTCVAPIELNRIQRQNYFIPNANLTDVYKKEGFRFFWKGNGVNCIRIFPQIAVNYSVFRQSKNIFKNTFENKNTVNFVSGCFAGCVSMISTYPLETTRTYLSLQTNKNKYKGILDILTRMPTKKLYRGLPVGLAMHTPWNSIQLTSYSTPAPPTPPPQPA